MEFHVKFKAGITFLHRNVSKKIEIRRHLIIFLSKDTYMNTLGFDMFRLMRKV